MSLTEFAMVEELAFLIKDNLPCKHLILSMEETLVNFLLDDTSSNGVLELEPMNPYNRLLLHRLADIFGFSHYSAGEGEERHLVLERCSETLIPSILISDLLWQYDEPGSPRTVDVISRRNDSEGSKVEDSPRPIFNISLEEREEAYLAARKRIFSVDQHETRQCITKDRPKKDARVARRMIEHALGQRITPREEQAKDVHIQHKKEVAGGKPKSSLSNGSNIKKRAPKSKDGTDSPALVKKEGKVDKESIREEQMGAAKRMFASALGFTRDRSSK